VKCRQTIPEQWLIADGAFDRELWNKLRDLPRGSGVLVLGRPNPREWRRLRRLARQRSLTLATEGRGTAARVHNSPELTRAMLRRTEFILISPIHRTRSHPGWRPVPRMRAATLARLAHRRAIALGGMDAKRFERNAPLGFIGWAGISAWSRA
jgi:thiamine-phosphate pyrophosphorylase